MSRGPVTTASEPGLLPPPESALLDLSVVIVSYNTAALLDACLRSLHHALARALLSGGAEVWVVDNASSDGSAALIREHHPEVSLLANAANLGFAAASNRALRLARGRYLLLLNPDTELLGDALSPLLAHMEANPQVGLATARLVHPDGSHQHSAFRFPTLAQALLDLFPLHPRLLDTRLNGRYPPQAYHAPFEIDHPLGACMLVRREAIAQVGLLDEGYFLYCEEIDWCLRLRRAGWRIACVPEAVILHHAGASTRQVRAAAFVELYRSRFRLAERYSGPAYRLALRWIVTLGMIRELAAGDWAAARGQLSLAQWAQWREACRQVLALAWSRGGR